MVPLRIETLSTRLRDLGMISAQQLERAKQDLAATQERFSVILARQGLLRDAEAGRRLATQLGAVPQRVEMPAAVPTLTGSLPTAVWLGHRLVPFREENGRLLLATDDPLSVFALEFLSQRCGCILEAVLVREQDFTPLLTLLGKSTGLEPSPSMSPAVAPPSSAPTTSLSPTATSPSQRLSMPAQESRRASTPTHRTPATAPPSHEDTRLGAATASSVGAGEPVLSPSSSQRATQPAAASTAREVGDEPIVQLVDSMFQEAVRMRASDIHIEPGAQQLRVRYRIDGVLHDVNSPPKALQGPMISRIKILAGLNIAEKRLPQDGRLQLAVGGHALDVRISTLPATHGESVVMRLLDRSQPVRGLPEMGLGAEDQEIWNELIHRPHGMVLVTGPTGSGKTTTLYGALAVLNQTDRKLITVEDPVEYQLAGVNQVAVKSSIGLTFAAGLRAMLRQAPDVIMVGEIRDQETAQIAIQAALTGHLVLSTLHTNDAPSAITRLIDMGIAPFLVASTVQGVLAQRLVRRICSACRLTDNATADERVFLGQPEVAQVIRSVGCEKCHGSGFFGRVGLFELLVANDAVRRLVVTKASASNIRATAVQAGMRGLLDDGRTKIRDGVTTMAEVLRVVSDA